MTSTPTNTTTNGSTSSMSTQSSTEPPTKKQRSLLYRSVTDIQRILECPVCYNTPENPEQANFCSNGHMLCDGCHKKIIDKKCPTCRSEIWNDQTPLMPLMKQILSALPKVCPFPECEIQLEEKERNDHVKNCQHRLFDCAMFSGMRFCLSKVTFKGCLKHFEEAHKNKPRPNTQGLIQLRIPVNDADINGTRSLTYMKPYVTEFDGHTFILRCLRENSLYNIQLLLLGNITEAEKYSYEVKANTLNDAKFAMTFKADVISMDVPIADFAREKHSGTFTFTNFMANKWILREVNDNQKKLSFDITIIKNDEIQMLN